MGQTPKIHCQAAQYCTLTVGLYTIIPRRTTVPKKLVHTSQSGCEIERRITKPRTRERYRRAGRQTKLGHVTVEVEDQACHCAGDT